jgi:hypothetical protein
MPTMRIARFAALLAVALALVITGAVAGAAGQALILGQANSASGSQTGLTANLSGAALLVTQNGDGTPLKLVGPSDRAPLAVNSSKKVTNLNADRVDGQSAAAFMPSATYRKSVSVTVLPSSGDAFTVACDAGDRVLSSGYGGKRNSTNVTSSLPGTNGTFWVFGFENLSLASDTVTLEALCGDFAPHH